jgi:two-component system, OmpR family, phosphate regulon sensor histidine kinase PhoR
MQFSPRWLAIVLSLIISFLTMGFLSLVNNTFAVLVVSFSIAFSTSFILFYFTLQFFILGDINDAFSILEKLKKKDFKLAKKQISNLSAIQKLNEELYAYATNKQKEIDHLHQLAVYRREFLADVSHELKTPIFATQGFIETLLDGAVDDEEVRYKFLEKASRSLEGLNNLVEDLFTLSQMEAKMITMHPRLFMMEKLVLEVFEQLEEKAYQRSISLIIKNQGVKNVFADRNRIAQVITNLVNNAIKYGKNEGKVEVQIQNLPPQKVLIEVIDNGAGIPVEHLDRIFERFYRVEKSRSKEKGGSGLGLAIVKHILEAHNHKVNVQSKVNEGTIFSFELDAKEKA